MERFIQIAQSFQLPVILLNGYEELLDTYARFEDIKHKNTYVLCTYQNNPNNQSNSDKSSNPLIT